MELIAATILFFAASLPTVMPQAFLTAGDGYSAGVPVPAPKVPARAPPGTYHLPDGANLIVGEWTNTFQCSGRIYGYYADQDNDCKIFHACVPFVDEYGNDSPVRYSFFCGNQTVFDQQYLVCAHPQDATPCSDAASYYSVNENFGKTDKPYQ